jgi:hypothetical protein
VTDEVSWDEILAEMAKRDRLAEPVHPTLHVGPNAHEALIAAGALPEDLTLVTPDADMVAAYIAEEMPKAYLRFFDQHLDELNRGGMTGEPLGILGMTEPGQELDITRDGTGGSYVEIGGKLGKTRYDGPAPWEPQQQNDMRPRVVDRAKVKAARKAARGNRRKRGKH